MPRIVFVDHSGERREVNVASGLSVMQGAVDNLLEGIIGECGGSCSCATCHCYIDDAWLEKVGPAMNGEKAMLDCVFDPQPNSRLACQVLITEDLDGLVIRLPETQE
jgi:ferredoxin, 2Fe-2S